MKKTNILSYIAIAISIVSLVLSLTSCCECRHHRAPRDPEQAEMERMLGGEHRRGKRNRMPVQELETPELPQDLPEQKTK